MDNAMRVAQKINEIEFKVFDRRGFNSRPYGRDYMLLFLEIAAEIVNNYLNTEITDEVIDLLEDWNAHTACSAARMLMNRNRYAMYDYAGKPTYDLVMVANWIPF